MKRKIIYFLTESIESSDSDTLTSKSTSELSSLSSEDNLTNNESDYKDDILFLFLIKHLIFQSKKRHKVYNYLAVVECLTQAEFKEHFRVTKTVVNELIDEIKQSHFIPQHTFGIKPISGKLSILIFLWFMANTEPLRTIADRFDVSISSVFRIVRRVIAWILTKLNDIIKWPQGNRIQTICDRFYSKKRIPKVLGAIDSTHIHIGKPTRNADDYYNRKKYFSINLQAIVDSELYFIHVYCGEPGSLHDSRVLRRSSFYDAATEHKEIMFPQNTFIIGDSAFPSLPWLVPPFRDNGHLTPEQTEFNYMLSSTRMVVEKAFGLLKGRFRRIKFFAEYKELSFVTDVIIAACMLHNYCIFQDDCFDIDNYNTNDVNEVNVAIDENTNHVMDRRRQLFNELFP